MPLSFLLTDVRQAWRSVFGGDSLTAAGALLQRFQGWRTFALRDTSMAGVPVTFAYPQGLEVNSSAVPADTKLLMYLHGGGTNMIQLANCRWLRSPATVGLSPSKPASHVGQHTAVLRIRDK